MNIDEKEVRYDRGDLRRVRRGERDRSRVDREFGGIEDDEASFSDDVNVDRDGAGEFAGGEVRLEPEIVALRYREFWKTRFPLEILHRLREMTSGDLALRVKI